MKILCNILIGAALIFTWIWVFIATDSFNIVNTDVIAFGAVTLIISIPAAIIALVRNNIE